MFFKTYHFLFLNFLFMGTMIAASANSWYTAWLGLEFNLMSMIPLILIKLNSNLTEAAIKYFLAQALASIFMIFSVALNFFYFNSNNLEMMEILMILALTLKLGVAPLHFWFPQVNNKINWSQNIIMLTWQKIAPFLLIMSLPSKILMFLSMMTAMVGAIAGFNQLTMKLILTYSSISHSGWLLMTCLLNSNYWYLYFFMYSVLSISIIYFFMSNKIMKINQIFLSSDNIFSKYTVVINILSLGGLPPLMGFSAKLSVILISLKTNFIWVFLILIMSSLISLYFYTRILYSSMMNFNKMLLLKTESPKLFPVMFFFTFLMNIFTPSMFFMT